MTKNNWSDVLGKEASIASLFQLFKLLIRGLRTNFKMLMILTLLTAGITILLGTLLMPRKSKAELILVTDEQGPSGWESLLAQFGLDLGSSNPSGVFQGESLVKFFMTRNMIERTLSTKVYYRRDSVLIAEIIWPYTKHARKDLFKNIHFESDRKNNTALTDSALFLTFQFVRQKLLSVAKPEKKQSMIHVAVIHENPVLAKLLAETHVKTVANFYKETLTQKARQNMEVLRQESDSVRNELNSNLYRNAYEADLNVTPLRQTMRVSQNRSMIDLQVTVALFGELTKNLKLAEISLRKETPLIQIIDPPQFPLEKVGFPWYKWGAIGAVLGLLLSAYLIYLREKNG
jgi:hypothetical protein